MAGVLKQHYPQCKIIFLGRTYTKDVAELSKHIDAFINYDEIEKLETNKQIDFLKTYRADVFLHVFPKKEIAQLVSKSNIPWRVGTSSRLYHWVTCNIRFGLSRKNSNLHEAQLNIKLLQFIGIQTDYTLSEIKNFYGFTRLPLSNKEVEGLLDNKRINVILHPKSKGSAREWGLTNFAELVRLLPESKYRLFVSGTLAEGALLKDWISQHKHVTDITGKLNLAEFIAFINSADALVAASTGPLHIASALGKTAIGLFAPMRPIHPGRWQPIGDKAHFLVVNRVCGDCRKSQDCHCIREISPKQVVDLLNKNDLV